MISRLYAIVDAQVLEKHRVTLEGFAKKLREAGVVLVQYRDKLASPQDILRAATVLRETFAGIDIRLIMNDRADLRCCRDSMGCMSVKGTCCLRMGGA